MLTVRHRKEITESEIHDLVVAMPIRLPYVDSCSMNVGSLSGTRSWRRILMSVSVVCLRRARCGPRAGAGWPRWRGSPGLRAARSAAGCTISTMAWCWASGCAGWTAKSLRRLAAALRELGHQISHTVVGELLRARDYSLQGNR